MKQGRGSRIEDRGASVFFRFSIFDPRSSILAPVLLLSLAFGLVPCFAQQIHRNSFESNTSWFKGSADVAYEEQAHVITDQGAHDGQRCEYIQIKAGQGSHVHYQYNTGRAPLGDDLNVALWVKSNRPGVQLLARVVLPNERDPNSLQDRLTTVLQGEVYRGPPGRWKRLELGRVVALTRQQQQLMQARLGRPVNFTGAYVDALLLNVYGGSGITEVWIDALEVGPVLEPRTEDRGPRTEGTPTSRDPRSSPARRAAVVEFNGMHLTVDGRRFFFRGIRHSDTPIKVLRDAGFNALFCDASADPALLRQSTDLGFLLVPHLPVTSEATLASREGLTREVRRFPEPDSVLFWNLGNALAHEQVNLVSRSAQLLRAADPLRPLGVDAWDGLGRYSGSLQLMVGVHRWPLMTTLELSQYRDWLEQRRRLATPGAFLWSWIQTHTPEFYTTMLYDRPANKGFEEPIGPQPEQIRLLTYTTLGVGARGVAFWSDRFLADSHQGYDRMLGVALLNQEIEMLEPLLVGVNDAPTWISTSSPEVQAAILRCPRAVLMLPMWVGAGAQFVPGQAAVSKLTVTVPHVPQGMQAWEVTPGEVRSLRTERVPGGMKVTLPEFGLTTAVVFTPDTQLIVRLQEHASARRQTAAQWTYEMAAHELAKTARVHEELQQRGLSVVDAGPLLNNASERLRLARAHWDKGLFSDAYREAQRSLRPMRILMRALWEKSVRLPIGKDPLDSPVSSPYAVSFFTLPRHVAFVDQLRRTTPAANALPGGDFEVVPGRPQESWVPQDLTLDDVELFAERVSDIYLTPLKKRQPAAPRDPRGKPVQGQLTSRSPAPASRGREPPESPAEPEAKRYGSAAQGTYCLKLCIRSKDREAPPLALDRTFLALNSPAVRLPPGSLVRVSAWVCIPEAITASPDGALLFDSSGGEPLALRLSGPMSWKKFTLYRKVPASGTVSVTLALTGLGSAYFDDVRIEPLVFAPGSSEVYPVAGQ
ncbi:MAG: hypothetical protein L0Z62_36000 [Gemmataceae bacterium]|nr:hypothetical protein [Gemmataceae bacterium]